MFLFCFLIFFYVKSLNINSQPPNSSQERLIFTALKYNEVLKKLVLDTYYVDGNTFILILDFQQ